MWSRLSGYPPNPRKGGWLWKEGSGARCTHITCDGLDPILQTASDFIAHTNDRLKPRLKADIRVFRGNVE